MNGSPQHPASPQLLPRGKLLGGSTHLHNEQVIRLLCVCGGVSLETRSHVARVDLEHPILLPLPKCGDNGNASPWVSTSCDMCRMLRKCVTILLTGNGDRIGVSTQGTAQQLGGHDNLQTAGHMGIPS